MRYFITLAYKGTQYSGWQIQPNAKSVQETLETAFSTLLQSSIEITGCGRTDTGVHATQYVAHFDTDKKIPASILIGVNSLLPPDIAVYTINPVHDQAHARFDAYERSYEYQIITRKNPFLEDTTWLYPTLFKADLSKIQSTATLLLQYSSFKPFCKTNSGVEHYGCQLKHIGWDFYPEQHRAVFHISANRFLRGMVRLIVGACLQVGTGKIEENEVKHALITQNRLPKSLSVPPQGLALTQILYPFTF